MNIGNVELKLSCDVSELISSIDEAIKSGAIERLGQEIVRQGIGAVVVLQSVLDAARAEIERDA